jgi:hypothetical protein
MSIPRISIRAIPHSQQRYETVGDWRFETTIQDGEHLIIHVSKMSDWRYEFLVVVHELIEVFLCRHEGITQKQVDKFDMTYEKKRAEGDTSEPGDAKHAPYKSQHCIATGVERILAAVLGVCWKTYDDEVNSL